MKKLTLLIVAFVLMFSLVACEKGNDGELDPNVSANPQSTPESTPGNELSQEQLLDEVVKNAYKNGVYEMEFSRKDSEKNTDTSARFNSQEKYTIKLNDTITQFSGLGDSNGFISGLYYNNPDLYVFDSYSNKTSKLIGDDLNDFVDMMSQLMVDIRLIVESAKDITVTKLEDGSYGVTLLMDTSKELSFLTAFINESVFGLPFSLSTTECKANLVVSEDCYVKSINVECVREGSDLFTDFQGNETVFFVGYSITYKLSYAVADRTIDPPEGMDIENSEILDEG